MDREFDTIFSGYTGGRRQFAGGGKLSEVLFVETLRSYINTLSEEQTGWLAGLRDPNLAKAFALMHRDPAREWTVDALAKDVGLSRTRLAERFRHFLGMSPIAYLTDWRMRIAAEALERTDKSVLEVAMDVGITPRPPSIEHSSEPITHRPHNSGRAGKAARWPI